MLQRILTGLVGLLVAGAVQAAPIQFDIDSAGSSVTVSGLDLCFGCELDTPLSADLGSTSFALEEGESFTFDFFGLVASGAAGAIGGTVTATLAFALPTVTGGTGTALAAAVWGNLVFGVAGAGGLSFISQPSNLAFGDGGLFSVAFSSASDECGAFGLFPSCTLTDIVTATVTLLQAPTGDTVAGIPEPSTLLLLGLGLCLVAVLMRRRAALVAA